MSQQPPRLGNLPPIYNFILFRPAGSYWDQEIEAEERARAQGLEQFRAGAAFTSRTPE